MDDVMNSVSVQIQRAINDVISNQVLPQIQNAIAAGSGHVPRKRWNVSAERPEANSETLRNVGTTDNSRSEHVHNRQNDDHANYNAYDRLQSFHVFLWDFLSEKDGIVVALNFHCVLWVFLYTLQNLE